MDIVWYGQACFKLKGKTASVVIDPYDSDFTGLKGPKTLEADLVAITHSHADHNSLKLIAGEPLVLEGPGEYEAKGVSVIGVSTFHDTNQGAERGKNTVFNIELDNMHIVHLGDLGHALNDQQIESIGDVDILLVPVGSVFTIDAKVAAQVVSSLEPRIIIPMHFFLPGLKFHLEGVEAFLKEMGVENIEPLSKFSITKDKLPEEPQVVVLSKT